MAKATVKFPATACLPFMHDGPSFALPLFSQKNEHQFFVQKVDEYTNLVSGFLPIEQNQNKVPLDDQPEANLGSQQIYAFVDEKGVAAAGTLSKLEAVLRSFLVRCPDYTAICVQIMELIGGKAEQRDAKIRMKNVILENSGDAAAAAFYEGSALRAALWNHLAKTATSEESARRILATRSKLSARISPSGDLIVNLEALDDQDRKHIDIARLTTNLMEEFDFSPESSSSDLIEHSEDDKTSRQEAREHIKVAMQELAIASRQERRLAIIFDVILNDPKMGRTLLKQYGGDAALFTNFRIMRLQEIVSTRRGAAWMREMVLGEVHQTLIDFYGLRKGELLLEFADRLGKYPEINAMIKNRLQYTQSRYVEVYKREIKRLLAKRGRRHHGGVQALPLFERN